MIQNPNKFIFICDYCEDSFFWRVGKYSHVLTSSGQRTKLLKTQSDIKVSLNAFTGLNSFREVKSVLQNSSRISTEESWKKKVQCLLRLTF